MAVVVVQVAPPCECLWHYNVEALQLVYGQLHLVDHVITAADHVTGNGVHACVHHVHLGVTAYEVAFDPPGAEAYEVFDGDSEVNEVEAAIFDLAYEAYEVVVISGPNEVAAMGL